MCLWPTASVLTVVGNILCKKKTVVGNVKGCSILENNLAVPQKTKHTLFLEPNKHTLGHLSQKK